MVCGEGDFSGEVRFPLVLPVQRFQMSRMSCGVDASVSLCFEGEVSSCAGAVVFLWKRLLLISLFQNRFALPGENGASAGGEVDVGRLWVGMTTRAVDMLQSGGFVVAGRGMIWDRNPLLGLFRRRFDEL